jgi:GNAT superfamily N-acetyltransferase
MEDLEIQPLTPALWQDFEQLFGPHGACAGCWCMYWKLSRRSFVANQGEGNRLAQREIVCRGEIPGLLAFVHGTPASWAAVERRDAFPTLARSRVLAALDTAPVWSLPCFFVAPSFRGRGITLSLLQEAVRFAARRGGKILEGYPIEPRTNRRQPPLFIYTGLASTFLQAGFQEAGRRSATRPIMRRAIG